MFTIFTPPIFGTSHLQVFIEKNYQKSTPSWCQNAVTTKIVKVIMQNGQAFIALPISWVTPAIWPARRTGDRGEKRETTHACADVNYIRIFTLDNWPDICILQGIYKSHKLNQFFSLSTESRGNYHFLNEKKLYLHPHKKPILVKFNNPFFSCSCFRPGTGH